MVRDFMSIDLFQIKQLLNFFNCGEFNLFNNDFERIKVYEEDNIIKGAIVYLLLYDRIEIEYLIVDNTYRNKKIATKLLQSIELIENIKNITLEVRESNLDAISLYIKNGYNCVLKRKNYYKNEDGFLFIKEVGVDYE